MTPQLTAFFGDVFDHFLAKYRPKAFHWPEAHLIDFEQVLAADSSVVALRDMLRQTYMACAHAKSALKLHAVVNVLSHRPERFHLTGQHKHDLKRLRWVRQWARRKLLLLDLGYYSFALLATLDKAGGFFISRAKTNFNPLLLQDNYQGPGQPAQTMGRKLKAVLAGLKRTHFDARVLLSAQDGSQCEARVIAERDKEGKWRVYLTNLSAEPYPAEELSQLYRLRWQAELVFKQLKNGQQFDVQTGGKAYIVELRITLILLGYVMTGKLCELLEKRRPQTRYPMWRGLEAVRVMAGKWLEKLCEPYRSACKESSLFERMVRDPIVFRERSYDPLLRTSRLVQAA